jgi:UDP-N-acetyl-D-mannosaminuronic acid transferase (WecB/TagA/CpsF family)
MGGPSSLVPTRRILGMRVDATSYQHASAEILRWGSLGESRYVCIATVNNVIEAYDDPTYHQVMDGADLVTPDGVPLVWRFVCSASRERPESTGRTSPRYCANAPPPSASRWGSMEAHQRCSTI